MGPYLYERYVLRGERSVDRSISNLISERVVLAKFLAFADVVRFSRVYIALS